MRVGILEAEENYGVTVVVFADETTAETFEFQDATVEDPYCLVVDSENSRAGTCDRAEAVIVAALSASRREEQVGSEDEQLACQLPRTVAGTAQQAARTTPSSCGCP